MDAHMDAWMVYWVDGWTEPGYQKSSPGELVSGGRRGIQACGLQICAWERGSDNKW